MCREVTEDPMNRNNIKTAALLGSLGGALVLAGSAFGGRGGATIGLVLGLVMVGGSYWFSDRIAVRAAGASEAPDGELNWLRDDIAQMSATAGIPTPRLYLSPNQQPNAFATGRNEQHAVVCVTAGLLQALDRRQIRAVVGHELGHVKSHDILISSVAAAIATGITYIARMAMWGAMFGGGRNDDRRENPLGLFALMIFGPMAAGLLQMALSRSREFEADRVGAHISGDPEALADALARIEAYVQRVPMNIAPSQSSAWIVNPLTGRKVQFANLFMTHPPTAERIARLRRH